MGGRRIKILSVSNMAWRALFSRNDYEFKSLVLMKGWPEDGRVVDAKFNWERDSVDLMVESATFDEAYPGCTIERFQINITTTLQDDPIAIG